MSGNTEYHIWINFSEFTLDKENSYEFSSDDIYAPSLLEIKLNGVNISEQELDKISKRYPKLRAFHNCKNKVMNDGFVSLICKTIGERLISLGIGGVGISDKRFGD